MEPSEILSTASAIVDDIESRGHLASSSADVFVGQILRFARFCEQGLGRTTFAEVTEEDAEAWILSRGRDGEQPTISTQHNRRAALRVMYGVGWSLGLLDVDPTRHFELPGRTGRAARPLGDDEIVLGRVWATDVRSTGHRGVVWALAEAGGSQGEISNVCVEDIDLDRGTVTFRAGSRAASRTTALTAWGLEQVTAFLGRDGAPTEGSLLDLTPSAVGMTLKNILRDAGLRDAGIRARSIVAWAGVQVFAATGSIEEVARRLGMKSLDGAARLIGWSWR